MNSLFGLNTSLSSLAKDLNGFVREVVGELQTVHQQETADNDEDKDLDDEQAIEDELKHQLLELSDDEDGASSIIRNNDNDNDNDDDDDDDDHENNTEHNVSLEEYNHLHQKYFQMKQNYRKSMLLVEKYQIHNKSLKETLNEQMIIREKQQSQIQHHETINHELNNKLVQIQNELESIKQCDDNKVSIFEDDTSAQNMVLKSVSLGHNKSEESEKSEKAEEADKLRETLQKASKHMKALKNRYKKVKDDLCVKIEEFDELKSQYADFKMSSANKLKDVYDTNGVSKALQTILNLNNEECTLPCVNPIHSEMIAILNGCIDTISWLIQNNDSIIWSEQHLESAKMNVVTLRVVVCEFIAILQQWLKVLNEAIENSKSISEEFQSID